MPNDEQIEMLRGFVARLQESLKGTILAVKNVNLFAKVVGMDTPPDDATEDEQMAWYDKMRELMGEDLFEETAQLSEKLAGMLGS